MKHIKLSGEFLTTLEKFGSRRFTVDEFTQAYLKEPGTPHTSKKSARQFVYRLIQRLIESGDMERSAEGQGWPRYSVTAKFSSTAFKQDSKPYISTSNPTAIINDSFASLKERLHAYKAEMLSTMGEIEEYEIICKELPELRETVQPRYNESRERCSKLVGRVKALESLLVPEC